jgi:NAD(P)-dependent dehydrogenase (short-subunit alcohol dehydrogenase family)
MRHVLITGGSSGIGLACARAFLAAGETVTLVGRDATRLAAAIDTLGSARASGECCDVASAVAVTQMALRLQEAGRRVDVLVNNAGLFLAAPVLKVPEEQAAQLWECQVMGPWRMLKACAAADLRGEAGLTVVNILSVTALKSFPACGFYGATKAALKNLMETARAELRQEGVRICNVFPGATDTPIWGERGMDRSRMMPAEDVAAAVLACAAPHAGSLVEDLVMRPVGGDL